MENSTAVKTVEELKQLFDTTAGEAMRTLPFQGWEAKDHPVVWADSPLDVIQVTYKPKGSETEVTKKQMVAYINDGETVENITLAQAEKIVPNGNATIKIREFIPNAVKNPDFKINKASIIGKSSTIEV